MAFDQYTKDGEQGHLDAIAVYNEDDVQATQALHDWLVQQRPVDLDWRVVAVEADEEPEEIDALLDALSEFEDGTEQRLLADLLGYWLREWHAYIAPMMGILVGEPDRHLDDPNVLSALGHPQQVDTLTPKGKVAKWPSLRLSSRPSH